MEETDEEVEDLEGEEKVGDLGDSSIVDLFSSTNDIVACACGRSAQLERRCLRRRIMQSRQRPPGSLVRPRHPRG